MKQARNLADDIFFGRLRVDCFLEPQIVENEVTTHDWANVFCLLPAVNYYVLKYQDIMTMISSAAKLKTVALDNCHSQYYIHFEKIE